MWRIVIVLAVSMALTGSAYGQAKGPTTAPSRVTAVTVYQGNALVTREVLVPQGTGLMELVVTPLPPRTIEDRKSVV